MQAAACIPGAELIVNKLERYYKCRKEHQHHSSHHKFYSRIRSCDPAHQKIGDDHANIGLKQHNYAGSIPSKQLSGGPGDKIASYIIGKHSISRLTFVSYRPVHIDKILKYGIMLPPVIRLIHKTALSGNYAP